MKSGIRTSRHGAYVDVPEEEVTEAWRVACDGGEGALGHPRVWLQIPDGVGYVDCGYCDKRYIHASMAATDPDAAPGSNAGIGEAFGDRTDGDGLDQKV